MSTATGGGFGSISVTVTGAAATLASLASNDLKFNNGCAIKNPTGGTTIYLGGSDVDATVGFPLYGGETVAIDADGLSRIYAYIAAGSQAIKVLYSK